MTGPSHKHCPCVACLRRIEAAQQRTLAAYLPATPARRVMLRHRLARIADIIARRYRGMFLSGGVS